MRFGRFRRESEEAAHARAIADLRNVIRKHGWAVRNVMPGPTAEEVRFSYTIGLTAFGHPEVIILGMPSQSAHEFLNLIGDEVRRGGQYEGGTMTGEFTDEDAPIAFIRAEDTERLTAVEQIYGQVSALQMIWPDSTGRLPWQDGYRNPSGAQPLLGPLPDEWGTSGAAAPTE
jgi:hypothetical protein